MSMEKERTRPVTNGLLNAGKTRVNVTLAVAIPVGTVLAVVVIVGVSLYRRNVNRKKKGPGTPILSISTAVE